VPDAVFNHCDYTWHVTSSGSKAEGLNLPGSDFDVMLINKHINVYERDDVLE
jgi:predicted nucleotidyltransferase